MAGKRFIKNVSKFRDNFISSYITKYVDTENEKYYNLGWGNLSDSMINFNVPSLFYDKEIIRCYNDPQGMSELKKEIINFIDKKGGGEINKNNLLITNGATNALFLLSCYFKDCLKIKEVLMQNPTYDTAINIFKSQDYKIKTINVRLKKINAENKRLAYLMFNFHNPTGINIDENRKQLVRDKLTSNGCYLIEDDSYGLLGYQAKIDLFENKKYVYVGSFSKYLFPGLRMGFIIAHEDIIEQLTIIQKYYNSHPNTISQIILLDYLKTGKIYVEIEKRSKLLRTRREAFVNSLHVKIKKLIISDQGGFYYWFQLSNEVNLVDLFVDLLKNKIIVIPGDIYFLKDRRNALRVCISSIPFKDISEAGLIFSKIMEKYV